ncbi:MAG TPA: DoxX family protein [Chloroflexota bacterium]
MINLALFILRATVGGLIAGHGAQKLFGAFEGPGPEGTRGMMQSLGYDPPHVWATAAGASEFAGGLLTAAGFLNPLGPLAAMGSMLTATRKVHWGKPVWVTAGGAELPLTNIAALSALTLAGPGAISLDRIFGVRLPAWFTLLATGATLGVTISSINASERARQEQARSGQAKVSGRARVRRAVEPGPDEPVEVTEGS